MSRQSSPVPMLALSAAIALTLAGCASKAPKELPPAPGPAVSQSNEAAPQLAGPVPGSEGDFAATMLGQDTIHFDFDKYGIDATAAQALRVQAQWFLKYPNARATIQGHCDERGTREYNLALGERRANATRDYLVSLGVAASRLNTVSYGKERPVDPASNERAWAANRRAVSVVIDTQ